MTKPPPLTLLWINSLNRWSKVSPKACEQDWYKLFFKDSEGQKIIILEEKTDH